MSDMLFGRTYSRHRDRGCWKCWIQVSGSRRRCSPNRSPRFQLEQNRRQSLCWSPCPWTSAPLSFCNAPSSASPPCPLGHGLFHGSPPAQLFYSSYLSPFLERGRKKILYLEETPVFACIFYHIHGGLPLFTIKLLHVDDWENWLHFLSLSLQLCSLLCWVESLQEGKVFISAGCRKKRWKHRYETWESIYIYHKTWFPIVD